MKANILNLSPLALGTVKIGRNQAMKYPNAYELPSDKEVLELLDLAEQLGINCLDTAPAYGIAEERLGKLIKGEKWLISTKTGEEFENGKSFFDFSQKHTLFSVERSLKRLKKDYLDLVFIHSNGEDKKIITESDCLETLFKLKEQGKIRAVGFSGKTNEGAMLAIKNGVDALMLTLNPEYQEELPAIMEAEKKEIMVFIKKSFGSGHLIKNYGLEKLAEFAFSYPITSLILGTINPKHLKENVEAVKKAIKNENL